MNVLTDSIFTVRTTGETRQVSLPAIFSLLVNNEIREFPSVSGLHYPAWHRFLVQLGASVTDGSPLPQQENTWKNHLLNEAPGPAWRLEHSDYSQPAFLQPDVPEDANPDGAIPKPFKVAGDETPLGPPLVNYDAFTPAKNHGIKRNRTQTLTPEDEIYRVIALQTVANRGGAKQKRSSRMNGAYASRPFFTVTDTFRPGPWITREIQHFRSVLREIAETHGYKSDVSPLLWTISWRESPISREKLHPAYIDCARRLRRIEGKWYQIKTEDARVESAPEGNTGDYWAPVQTETAKVLNPSRDTFRYDQLHAILFDRGQYSLPPSFKQEIDEGYIVCQSAISYDQTGFDAVEDRRLQFSKSRYDAEPVAEEAKRRYASASTAERILKRMLENIGIEKDDEHTAWLRQFRQAVDQMFFDRLFVNAEKPLHERRRWDRTLIDILDRLSDKLDDRASQLANSRADYWRRAAELERAFQGLSRTKFEYLFANATTQ